MSPFIFYASRKKEKAKEPSLGLSVVTLDADDRGRLRLPKDQKGARVSKIRWPERLEIVAAMPLTPTRKIIKGELARRLEPGPAITNQNGETHAV